MNDILLSVVATSRNDNHGKNLHYRMQQFVSGFVEQCKRHNLKAELILVEWNPPDNTPPLSQALEYPQDKGPCSIRIVTVPKEVHAELDHSDKIPLFQMIGKNVGIRRAKGKFVLATNIDIIFSDALMNYLKSQLQKGYLYRVDRLDVPEQLPTSDSYDDVLRFCAKNILRINDRTGTFLTEKNERIKFFSFLLRQVSHPFIEFFLACKYLPKKFYHSSVQMCIKKSIPTFFRLLLLPFRIIFRKLWKLILKSKPHIKKLICLLIPNNTLFPHTNACGDFTLLSMEDWNRLKGYPEWNIFSWHLDSVFIYQALQHGIIEKDLPRRMSIYHIEHEAGSGFSPEYAHLLFTRLNERKIPYIDNDGLKDLITRMNASKERVVYNDDHWGMADRSLKEMIV